MANLELHESHTTTKTNPECRLILEVQRSSFDVAYSSLTFHYVRDFGRLIRMIYRALVPRGSIVFMIEHPIFMVAIRVGTSIKMAGRPGQCREG